MDIIKSGTSINFMGQRKIALGLSVALIVLSIVSLAVRGLDFGLDFTGGTLIEISYPSPPELGEVRSTLTSEGFEDFTVQTFGSAREIVVRIPAGESVESGADLSTRVLEALSDGNSGIDLRRVEFVGPQVGQELAEQGGLALLYALFGISISVAFCCRCSCCIDSRCDHCHGIDFTIRDELRSYSGRRHLGCDWLLIE